MYGPQALSDLVSNSGQGEVPMHRRYTERMSPYRLSHLRCIWGNCEAWRIGCNVVYSTGTGRPVSVAVLHTRGAYPRCMHGIPRPPEQADSLFT